MNAFRSSSDRSSCSNSLKRASNLNAAMASLTGYVKLTTQNRRSASHDSNHLKWARSSYAALHSLFRVLYRIDHRIAQLRIAVDNRRLARFLSSTPPL